MKKSSFMKAALTAVALMTTAAGVTALTATPAAADIAASKSRVDAAKKQGIVGEQNDGFLGFVRSSSDAALNAAVEEINAGRRDVYAQAAAKNGVSVEAAGQSAFVNVIVKKMSVGDYYQDASGSWVQK